MFRFSSFLGSYLSFVIFSLVIAFLPGPTYVSVAILFFVFYLFLSYRSLQYSLFHMYLLTLIVGRPWLNLNGRLVQDFVFFETPVLLMLPEKISYRFLIFIFFTLSLVFHKNGKGRKLIDTPWETEKWPLLIIFVSLVWICLGQIFGNYILKYRLPFFEVLQIFFVFPLVCHFLDGHLDRKFYSKVNNLFVGFISFSVTLQGILAIIQFVIQKPLGMNLEGIFAFNEVVAVESGSFRSPGLLGHPNSLGVFNSMFVPFLIFLYLKKTFKKGGEKLSLKSAIIFGFVGVVLSFSRWAWFSLVVTMIILCYFYGEKIRLFVNKKFKINWKVLMVFGTLLLFLPLVIERLTKFATLRGRMEIIKISLAQIEKYPIWGMGPGNSTISLEPYRKSIESYIYSLKGVHNTLLLLAVENGLFVAFLFVLFVVVVFYSFVKLNAERKLELLGYLLIIVSFLVNSLAYSLYIWDPFMEIFFLTCAFYYYSLKSGAKSYDK